MSQKTKLFGFEIPVQPKFLLGGLFAVIAVLAWYNFTGGSDGASANSPHPALTKTVSNSSAPTVNPAIARRADLANKGRQGTLRLKPVDPATVVDPTLKLSLLDRVDLSSRLKAGAICLRRVRKYRR